MGRLNHAPYHEAGLSRLPIAPRQVLKDERFVKHERSLLSKEELAQQPQEQDVTSAMMLETDGQTHRRLRGLVHKVFTPQLVENLRERIESICAELLEKAAAKGAMDIVADYAFPLSAIVICEMLGVPSEDRDRFGMWTTQLMNQSYGPDVAEGHQAMLAMLDYLRGVIANRRCNPKDDLITQLLQVEEAGEKLNDIELLAMTFMLLIAGHETTVAMIPTAVLALLEHPAQMQKLRDDPSLIRNAIEELLRYTGAADNTLIRYAAQDVELSGVLIPRGGLVLVSLASVHRDPEQFENPDILDITRVNSKHIGFGAGPHYCLGAPLARLESAIAIARLLERMPKLRLATSSDELKWRPVLFVRSLEALPVRF